MHGLRNVDLLSLPNQYARTIPHRKIQPERRNPKRILCPWVILINPLANVAKIVPEHRAFSRSIRIRQNAAERCVLHPAHENCPPTARPPSRASDLIASGAPCAHAQRRQAQIALRTALVTTCANVQQPAALQCGKLLLADLRAAKRLHGDRPVADLPQPDARCRQVPLLMCASSDTSSYW